MLDWAALNAVSVACPNGDMVPARTRPYTYTRRHDDAAVAVVEDDVGAVGLGDSWRGLEELFSVHDLRFCRFIDFPGRPRFYLARGAAEWAGDVELA